MKLSVIIPTHNPKLEYLERVLLSLRGQTLPTGEWELLIIDNASDKPLDQVLDLSWLPGARIVVEPNLGLSRARIAGFRAATGAILILVDDDNVLAPDFLTTVVAIANEHPFLGTWSGNVELALEPGVPPPPKGWGVYLTERHVSQPVWSNDLTHNDSTPWGAGLCIRRQVADSYLKSSQVNPAILELDLQGQDLVYGGDTDIAYHGCSLSLGKGVFPQLQVLHLIPARRCEHSYLLKVIEGRAYSEWLHHWVHHKKLPAKPKGFALLKTFLRFVFSNSLERSAELARRRGHKRAKEKLSVHP